MTNLVGGNSRSTFCATMQAEVRRDPKQREVTRQKDPVCGMQVDPAHAAGSSEHNGKAYYFCSSHCKQKFDRDPKQFVK